MKRAFVIVLSLLTMALGSYAWAQGPVMQTGGTKVGVVNMGKLYTGYKRVKTLKTEIDTQMKPYNDQKTELENLIKQWKQVLTADMQQRNPKITDADRERGRKTIIDASRRLEDLDITVKKEMGKKVDDMLTLINKEINDQVASVAGAHGYQLILAYGEPEQALPELAAFKRKMTVIDQGGMVVVYVSPNMDISMSVLQSLNSRYDQTTGGAPAPVSVPGNAR